MVDAVPLLALAFEREAEERAWQMWNIRSVMWSSEQYQPWPQFRDEFLGRNVDRRTDGEILADIEAAERELRREA